MEAYGLGITSLLIFVLINLVQGALVGAQKAGANMAPGAEPSSDYDDNIYRANRSHQNGVEVMAAAGIALIIAMLVGVSAFWVNLLMAIFLVTRILYILVYAQKIGKPAQGTRTMVYVAGWATLVILCVMSIFKVLF